jgi:hypothetical protein
MSASPIKNPTLLSNTKTYIIPVLIVVAGIMIAMGNMFSTHAATMAPSSHDSTITAITADYHVSGPVSGGFLK